MTTTASSRNSCSSERPTILTSPDGRIRFLVCAVDGGVYLQREVRRPAAGHVTQAVIFPSPEAFRRWRDADPLRFDSPILHASLERAAEAAFRRCECDVLAR